jgi:hypothetical protein
MHGYFSKKEEKRVGRMGKDGAYDATGLRGKLGLFWGTAEFASEKIQSEPVPDFLLPLIFL